MDLEIEMDGDALLNPCLVCAQLAFSTQIPEAAPTNTKLIGEQYCSKEMEQQRLP